MQKDKKAAGIDINIASSWDGQIKELKEVGLDIASEELDAIMQLMVSNPTLLEEFIEHMHDKLDTEAAKEKDENTNKENGVCLPDMSGRMQE